MIVTFCPPARPGVMPAAADSLGPQIGHSGWPKSHGAGAPQPLHVVTDEPVEPQARSRRKYFRAAGTRGVLPVETTKLIKGGQKRLFLEVMATG